MFLPVLSQDPSLEEVMWKQQNKILSSLRASVSHYLEKDVLVLVVAVVVEVAIAAGRY